MMRTVSSGRLDALALAAGIKMQEEAATAARMRTTVECHYRRSIVACHKLCAIFWITWAV
eukprot:1198147-Prymnesium_polylepis.1